MTKEFSQTQAMPLQLCQETVISNISKESFEFYQLNDLVNITGTHETRAIFLDISKTFDKVRHEGVVFKLKQNGGETVVEDPLCTAAGLNDDLN